MNLNSNINHSCSSIPTYFNHAMEQSHLRADSRSISIFRKLVVNENPVPEPQHISQIFPTPDKAMMDLSLNPWENKAESEPHSSQQRLSFQDQPLTSQINIAKVA
mmetsp:Transcript_22044/g.32573  ORF Transcript_22044/g.32573 Transcript_22044/m.32573 type:complete len:105 (-) Transcript_22044:249-563(-)|eukprot:CAMPEP_0194200716 /NCGR_PEP_ID=MMETSP0156-20130528/1200_1 /TAXON_ID=33649 /ORGANISM="Thalassionema nitzschioides, Strain L26-B" /LENGTH=104 /DNA_ID=CAMNT_0038925749 /DNA_START=104 /DNA_END=418 /DNA_ORIENTATION=+